MDTPYDKYTTNFSSKIFPNANTPIITIFKIIGAAEAAANLSCEFKIAEKKDAKLINSINGNIDEKAESIDILNAMEEYFPSTTLPYNNDKLELQVAQIYFMLGDEDEYRNRLTLIENREKINSETLLSVGQMYLSELNDYPKAYEVFNRLYLKDPKNVEYMYAAVQSLARMDKINEAVKILEDWLIIHPNDSQIKGLLNSLKGQINS